MSYLDCCNVCGREIHTLDTAVPHGFGRAHRDCARERLKKLRQRFGKVRDQRFYKSVSLT